MYMWTWTLAAYTYRGCPRIVLGHSSICGLGHLYPVSIHIQRISQDYLGTSQYSWTWTFVWRVSQDVSYTLVHIDLVTYIS